MRQFIKLFFIFSLFILLSGCSGLLSPAKLPPLQTYTITALHPTVTANNKRSRTTLLVTTPIAASGYQTNSMVYVTIPYKLKSFANNAWVAPPAQMILPLLAQRLRQTRYFYAVVTTPFSGIADFRLDTKLLELQQEFLQPTSQVRLLMSATLINNTTNQIVASREFQVVVNAPDNNPYSGVVATNKAVRIMNNQITQFVLRHFPRARFS